MSDVFAIFGILLVLGIAFPGMLSAWWLLFPEMTHRASQRLSSRPWSCFWLGLALVVISAIPITILVSLPVGPAQVIGWAMAVFLLGFASLGSSGIAAHMGARLNQTAAGVYSPFGAFVRTAIALELAAIFPFLGWFIVIPGAVLVSLGAAVFALWNRNPADATAPGATPQILTPNA